MDRWNQDRLIAVMDRDASRSLVLGSDRIPPKERTRRKAKKFVKEQGLEKVIAGLTVVARGKGTIMEEIPQAYKDVSEVVRVIHDLGIAKVVVRLKPLGTLKG